MLKPMFTKAKGYILEAVSAAIYKLNAICADYPDNITALLLNKVNVRRGKASGNVVSTVCVRFSITSIYDDVCIREKYMKPNTLMP